MFTCICLIGFYGKGIVTVRSWFLADQIKKYAQVKLVGESSPQEEGRK